MKISAFKQLKQGYDVSSPHWRNGPSTIKRIEVFIDSTANDTTATCFIETEHGHHVAVDSVLSMRDLRLRTAIPLYDEEREILNIDTDEIYWREEPQEGALHITGTLYNFEASEVVLLDFEIEVDARQSIIEALAAQAQNWAENSNGYTVRYINII